MKSYQHAELKVQNLENLKKYLNIYFYETLSMLQVRSRLLTNKLNEMAYVKNIFLDIEKKYKLKSFFYYNPRSEQSQQGNSLYVYIAEKIKLSGINSSSYENDLLKKIGPKDLLITIGSAANEFATKNELKPILSLPKNTIDNLDELKTLLFEYYLTGRVAQVKFVFVSNKINNGEVTILPINKFDIKYEVSTEDEEQLNIEKYNIYPNLNEFQNNLASMYVENVIYGMIYESDFYVLKKRLVKIRSNLNEIDKKIFNWNYEISKGKYDEINSDIILTQQSQK
ncbi:F0F1-type ATP synthase gamma subunit [Mycoplasmoides fastidiosum]|uniref:F0F1-type ATP synthase gamma subunit n=1 Tax=Mycoplasmoides fastidiosum TaxID=92758 RepID=A0ABU0LZF0_9BACT|nr:hypothetical protein [Mycoplasmoides fastidiosum]MDQ0514087.1 F0F1-type ATP synthase gamma subunit [Mycoplasmoides fastidiosum]UUD37503.1 hypothetical protein NPA10_02955 [Mycoplasmoides fastidiosum]